jgi:hypothetical protein
MCVDHFVDSGEADVVAVRGELSMHEFVIALVFVVLIMAPCVVALTTRLEDVDSK